MSEGLILIDTSAWVMFFTSDEGGDPRVAVEVEELILSGRACYTEPVFMEVSAGATSKKALEGFASDFKALELQTVCLREIWGAAEAIYPKLLGSGYRKKAMDVLISAVAIHYGLTLFHHDRDYKTIAKVTSLDEYSFLK